MVVTHGSLPAASGRWAVTIGNFDGVHLGHRALLERVNARARELEIGSCVLTFEPHPREFFAREAAPPRLSRLRDKLELIAQAGVARVHVARFDTRLASLPGERFIDEVLVRGLGARWLVVGRDFRFGKGRGGDFGLLEAAGRRHGFGAEALDDVLLEEDRVSSSAVRAALHSGDLRRAERLLGHAYAISGRVVHGAKLGRDLGFATANIPLRRPSPLGGIYVVRVEGLGAGVASVGLRPTVNPVPRPLLEVHLLNFSGDLYGRRLCVCFLEKLRDEEKYADLGELKQAIARDARRAQEYFAKHG
jgi:riboflavin kinase / FMN adenylyltransferase